MKDLTPLTSRNGESEWPYEGKTLIAVQPIMQGKCRGCYLNSSDEFCDIWDLPLPDCTADFDEPMIYIEKPAES